MNKFQSLPMSLCLTSLILGSWLLPIQAQTPNTSATKTVKKVVTLQQPNGNNLNFDIVGSREQVNNTAAVLATVLGAGVNPSDAKVVIPIVLAGADPVATTDLILSLNGLVKDKTNVDLTKLNQAINAYNTIVDKADANSLKSLNKTVEFTTIGDLLQKLRAPLS